MLYLHNKRIENCAGTLIVVPASLMNQWKQEIERYYDGKLQIILHHGQSRHTVPLQSYEIVITTYSSKKNVNTALTSDYNKYPDALYKRNWTRIVLDEAHEIANSETQKAKACFAITALYRWCVTGTPLQNSLMDVYSLFKFMNNNKYTNLSTYKDHF
jgi:SNF2 family DNA or RNA helicase